MKTDHGETPLRRQALESCGERRFEFDEFAVDMDAQRLKNTRGRMFVPLAGARDAGDHLGELERAFEARGYAGGDDGAGDARRKPLFAEFTKDADQLRFGRPIDDVGGGGAHALAHAHVKGSVLHETKAPRGIVELRGGKAGIE